MHPNNSFSFPFPGNVLAANISKCWQFRCLNIFSRNWPSLAQHTIWQGVFSRQPQYLFIFNFYKGQLRGQTITDKFLLWLEFISARRVDINLKFASKQNQKFSQPGETCGSSSACPAFWHQLTRFPLSLLSLISPSKPNIQFGNEYSQYKKPFDKGQLRDHTNKFWRSGTSSNGFPSTSL